MMWRVSRTLAQQFLLSCDLSWARHSLSIFPLSFWFPQFSWPTELCFQFPRLSVAHSAKLQHKSVSGSRTMWLSFSQPRAHFSMPIFCISVFLMVITSHPTKQLWGFTSAHGSRSLFSLSCQRRYSSKNSSVCGSRSFQCSCPHPLRSRSMERQC